MNGEVKLIVERNGVQKELVVKYETMPEKEHFNYNPNDVDDIISLHMGRMVMKALGDVNWD